MYTHTYTHIRMASPSSDGGLRRRITKRACKDENGQFSEFHVCFCGLDPGNLKFETLRTNT